MTVWMIVGVVITAAVAALTLRQSQPAFATVLTVAVGVLILAASIASGFPAVERIAALLEGSGIDSQYTGVLLKALGISLLTQSAADVCRDAGETALAGKTELAGKVMLLLSGLPLFEYAASLLESLIRGQAVIA